jgi:hypothetical protein
MVLCNMRTALFSASQQSISFPRIDCSPLRRLVVDALSSFGHRRDGLARLAVASTRLNESNAGGRRQRNLFWDAGVETHGIRLKLDK